MSTRDPRVATRRRRSADPVSFGDAAAERHPRGADARAAPPSRPPRAGPRPAAPCAPRREVAPLRGDRRHRHRRTPQYEVGERLTASRSVFPFDFAIMLGDNIYGGERPQDFVRKFELPYKALLDAGVKFYASLGNHDDPNQRFYKPFNMDGEALLHVREGQHPVLRARQQLHRRRSS